MSSTFALLPVVLALAALAVAQGPIVLRGRVVNQSGAPVLGADVATFWIRGEPLVPVQTDADGRFAIMLDVDETLAEGESKVCMVKDAARTIGAVCRFTKDRLTRNLVLTPLVEVLGRIKCPQLPESVGWTNVYVELWPFGGRLGRFNSDRGRFRLLLPKGLYNLNMYGGDLLGRDKKLFLTGRERVVDLSPVKLKATKLALLSGKQAPRIRISETRGCPKEVQFADYRGKYLLVEFWGYW